MHANYQRLMLLLLIYHFKSSQTKTEEEEIEYYVNLIEKGIEDSYKYKSPTDASEYKPTTSKAPELQGKYDFIIIGAGTSGSVLAGKLSAISEWDILVLEAGTFPNDFVDVPGMHFYDFGTKYNWNYETIVQNSSCLGFINSKCPEPRGKGFGGTSLINALIYSRANKNDYDKWEQQGNPGWNYKNVLKYFIRLENSSVCGDKGYHGKTGPLDVTYHSEESYQTHAFIDANKELGIRELDVNGANQIGVSRIHTNIKQGRRLSTYKAYLEAAKGKKNMHLLADSYVIKIYICEKTDVRKVYFTKNNKLYVAHAKKEIVLSAGAINSPQILMLSGIGPADHLKELGIPIAKNLQVGSNLQDHPLFIGMCFTSNATSVVKSVKEYVKEYLKGTGFYTIARNIQAIGYYETEDNTEKGNSNVELLLNASPIPTNYTKVPLGLKMETLTGLLGNANPLNTFIIYIILLHPKSQGTIRLKSKNPFIYPLIDLNFFSDPDDKDILSIYNMVKFIRDKLSKTKAFEKIGAKLCNVNLPACKQFQYDSKEYWYCLIKQLSLSIWHSVGTNKMGPDPKNGAVVDARFKVYGYKTLRIVDASVLPFSFAGHPAASCIMIGEKAYDIILEDYGKNKT